VVSECRLFYYHEERNHVQWECPPELYSLLGEWKAVKSGSTDSVFWYNAKANLSLWSDPTKICDVFEATLKGNVWFLHMYREFGGNLRTKHPTSEATVLHYAMSSGSAACVRYLLQHLPDGAVNDCDLEGNSALMYGVRYGYWNLCTLLADAKCDATLLKQAYELALEIGSHECAGVLEKFVNDPYMSLSDETLSEVADVPQSGIFGVLKSLVSPLVSAS